MKWKVLMGVATGYGLLLTLAAGGIAFANLAVILAGFLYFDRETATDPAVIRSWMHWGWYGGVCFALVSAVVTWLRKAKPATGTDVNESDKEPADLSETQRGQPSRGRPHGLAASLGWGGFIGGLLGMMLGCTFILLWFSIAYSPFAPDGWRSSISARKQRSSGSTMEKSVVATDHPVALYAFAIPVVLGAGAGAAFAAKHGVTDLS